MAIQASTIPKQNNFVGISCVWCMDPLKPGEKVSCADCLEHARKTGRSIGSWRASCTLPPKAARAYKSWAARGFPTIYGAPIRIADILAAKPVEITEAMEAEAREYARVSRARRARQKGYDR